MVSDPRNTYSEFLKNKSSGFVPCGFFVDDVNPMLFDWQSVLVRWALRKGKSAIFADCGLGKTPMQLEWAKHVSERERLPVLIFAPLAVSHQTVREGNKFGISVNRCNCMDDVKDGINISNYERIDRFDPSAFSGVVLDESSIIKNFTGVFRNALIDRFASTPYKLACSATPSPNDYTELGNTSEFLGVMTRAEMLSMFFINDSGDTTANWRLKGHVRKNVFWEWLSSWCVMLRRPSDIGYSDDGFVLPPLVYHEHVIPYLGEKDGLFVDPAIGLSEIRKSMRESITDRVSMCAEIVNRSENIWVEWCNLNDESKMLSEKTRGAVEVKGDDVPEEKESAFLKFSDNKVKALVTKPKIAMYGMNWQNCNNTVVTGLSHSFEQFYQLVRRFWRFGQKNPVHVHIVIGEREGRVLESIKKKERLMVSMFENMVYHMKSLMESELESTERKTTKYIPGIEMSLPKFLGVQ